MTERQPITRWAVIGIVVSGLGCLVSLAFLPLAEWYGELARASAGVGAIWMGLHLMVAAALCALGVLCGLIGLLRVRSGARTGKRVAWTGIFLGGLPLALSAIAFLASSADGNPLRLLLRRLQHL